MTHFDQNPAAESKTEFRGAAVYYRILMCYPFGSAQEG